MELTQRQRQIVELMSHGNAVKQIAFDLGISPLTIRKHIQSAFSRTGAANAPGIVAMALRKGWIK